MKQATIALLIEDLFQDAEVIYPYYRLQEAGHKVDIIGRDADAYTGKYGYHFSTDKHIDDVDVNDYDMVLIPGGFAPDLMRKDRRMAEFVAAMHKANKLVASICHGAWILASADIVSGVQATCYYAIADDLRNAGAEYVDDSVVVDKGIITSRNPDDLPNFMQAILAELEK